LHFPQEIPKFICYKISWLVDWVFHPSLLTKQISNLKLIQFSNRKQVLRR